VRAVASKCPWLQITPVSGICAVEMRKGKVRMYCRYDNELQQALQRADGAVGSGKARKQVVVLGAGMDTRAWRHAWLQGGPQIRDCCVVCTCSACTSNQVLRSCPKTVSGHATAGNCMSKQRQRLAAAVAAVLGALVLAVAAAASALFSPMV
jgi:Leucine carboxyl methyltransferase